MIDISTMLKRLVNHDEALDLSPLGWVAAFEELVGKLEREYPFTAWKGIEWQALRQQYQTRIAAAERVRDVRAYYLALRDFLYAIPDAQIELWGNDWGLRHEQISGGFGLDLIRLQDGRVTVARLAAGGAAARAGILIGAEILQWNDQPINEALEGTPIVWAERPVATRQARQLEQLATLTRAPIGTAMLVAFRNTTGAEPEFASLIALDDKQSLSHPLSSRSTGAAVLGRALPSGIGYIEVNALTAGTADRMRPNSIYRDFRSTLTKMIRGQIVGLVLDLRHCDGGDHWLAARLAGFFHPQPLFYAATATFDSTTGTFDISKPSPRTLVQIMPQGLQFDQPVAALIGPGTRGAAEGFARAVQRAPHGTVVGFGSSSGSFGGSTSQLSEVRMPLGYIVLFPSGRTLNQDGVIQIESNRFGEGGVTPNIRVPLDNEAFQAVYAQGRDVELTYAVYELTNAARRKAAPRHAPVKAGRPVPVPAAVGQISALGTQQA